jgi:hypothetical protein
MATELSDLRAVINDRLRQVNTAMPGRITKYDSETRKAEVEPLIQEKYADGTLLSLPKITNVPVVMPATSGAGFILPIGNGDPVLLLFSQRSLDRWLTSGGVQESADTRMHHLSDAIAIPGLFPFSQSHSDGAGLVVKNAQILIRLDGNKVAIGTVTVELLDEITKALDDIVTGLALIPYTATATIAASTAIKTIKGSV